MKILYDHQMFSRQKYGGVTKYFCELIKNLPKQHNYTLSLFLSNNQHLKDDFRFFKKGYFPIPQKESKIRGHLKSKLYYLNGLYSKYKISLNNFDLFHPTFYDTYFLKVLKKPYIITVHDLIFFKYRKSYEREKDLIQMTEVIKKTNRIIAISENTKKDLINILNVNPEKIDVIYHGFNKTIVPHKPNTNGRYILYVGARTGYKNFRNLAKAFKLLLIKDKNLKLLCVGSPFSKNEIEELKTLDILKNTFSTGVNETMLNQIYSHALAFVYPSEYEGFGMSILEAFANNCPVCLSNTSCLPEIAGEAGVYFDPTDVESIADSIQKVIYDSEFSKQLIHLGSKRLENFSWEKCAVQTTEAYQKALQ